MLVHARQASFDFHFGDVIDLKHLLGVQLVLVLLPHNQPPEEEDGRYQSKQSRTLFVGNEVAPCQVG